MRVRDPINEAEEPFNLVPLTDMVFNLLIFFMAATTFTQIEKDMAVQLPRSGGFKTLSGQPAQLMINIREDGTTWINGQQKDPAALASTLGGALKENPNREIVVRCDERSYVKYYATVLAQCRKAGVKEHKIAFIDGGGGGGSGAAASAAGSGQQK